MGKMLVNGAIQCSGRAYGDGDDEGVIVTPASNGYASLILGANIGRRSVFCLNSDNAYWRYNDGTNNLNIYHPGKNGTIAVTSDLTWDNISGKPSTFTPSTHAHSYIGDGTMSIYAERSNEINFGGTSDTSTIYFGYRTKDSKSIPTTFIFGNGVNGSAIIKSTRCDTGCLLLTNTNWTGYGTGDPSSSVTAVTGRVYFKIIS